MSEQEQRIIETIQQDINHYQNYRDKRYWANCLVYDAKRLLKEILKESNK